jgi:hypothetical protein
MQTIPTLNRRKLFTQWVLVNTIGMIVATPIITVLIISIITSLLGLVFRVIRNPATLTTPLAPDELSFITQGAYILGILITILSIVIPSLLLGVFQWLVLRTQIADSRKWILISFIGLSIGLSIGVFGGYSLIFNKNLPSISLGILSGGIGAIIGATLGIVQWFFLRKYVKYSSLWILGNIISCSLGTNMAWGWPSFLGPYPGDDTGLTYIFAFIVLIIRLMFIYSVISGIMLTWMLNHPAKELQMATAA